jgi:hypothetical protein
MRYLAVFCANKLQRFRMKKTSSLFLTTLFLAMQMIALLHMAKYGFAKHNHDGHVCGIYLLGKQTKSVDVTPPVDLPAPVFITVKRQSFTSILLSSDVLKVAPIRGPPACPIEVFS